MNLLEVIVIIILVLCAAIGYCRGFLKTVYSIAAWFFILVCVSFITPYLTNFLEEHTGLKDSIQEKCVDYMESISDSEELPIGELLTETGVYDEVAGQMAHFIIEGISFFAVMLIIGIVTFSVSHALHFVSKIPLIQGPDKILGAAFGGLKGLVFVWLLFYIISVSAASEFGEKYLGYINDSALLTFLYDHNVLVTLIIRFMQK